MRLFVRKDGRTQTQNPDGRMGPVVTPCPPSERGKPVQTGRGKGRGKRTGNDIAAHNSNRRKSRTDTLTDGNMGSVSAQFAFRQSATMQIDAQIAYDAICVEFGNNSEEAKIAFSELITAGGNLAKSREKFMASCRR